MRLQTQEGSVSRPVAVDDDVERDSVPLQYAKRFAVTKVGEVILMDPTKMDGAMPGLSFRYLFSSSSLNGVQGNGLFLCYFLEKSL